MSPTDRQTADLESRVRGRVRRPGEDGFAEASAPFNKRFATTTPALVVSAADTADVVAAIGWARTHGVPLVARGGGHGYAGTSVTTGLVLDLRALDTITVDPATGLVTAGGGTRMNALYAVLQEHDLAIPLGNSDDVSVAGLTLGGGVAAVSRAFGVTCDSLVETEIVLADGTVLTCDEERNADLFWACRGGGGGVFGVNTSFTFRTRPTRPSSTCLLLWHGEDAAPVLARMQEVMRDAPDAFSARIGVNRTTDGPTVVSVIGQHLGPADELRRMLAPALAVAVPYRADIEDRTYWEAKDYLHHNTSGDPFAVRTRTVAEPLGAEAVTAFLTALDKWPGSSNPDGAGVALFTWGGAMNRVPATATAFPHRDVLFLVSMDTSWGVGDSPSTIRANLDWLTGLHDSMGDFAGDGAYLNFADPDLEDWGPAYHGPNLRRLREIKQRYDPDRFFDFPQAL
ncbi:FAD-binding oxidoreductase [Kitasatospora sp. NBC_01539]|uniref:FAD-binding oxidoreductase n=1 Tax=Kitasatospora sp. NBC_01539 TaxID=2903577 RepID=UPI00386009E5